MLTLAWDPWAVRCTSVAAPATPWPSSACATAARWSRSSDRRSVYETALEQWCIRFLTPPLEFCWGRILSYEKGREYHSWEYNMEKRERGSNIIFPTISRLLGRISIREKGRKLRGRKSKLNKIRLRNFIHPWKKLLIFRRSM